MQKYVKNEETGELIENLEYNQLYELININENRIIILEK